MMRPNLLSFICIAVTIFLSATGEAKPLRGRGEILPLFLQGQYFEAKKLALSWYYYDKKRYEGAERSSVERKRHAVQLTVSSNNVAEISRMLGDFPAAEMHFRLELQVEKEMWENCLKSQCKGSRLRDRTISIAKSYNNVSLMYRARGRNAHALMLLDKADELLKRANASEQSRLKILFNKIDINLRSRNLLHVAADTESLISKLKHLKLPPLERLQFLTGISFSLSALKRYEDAKTWSEEALSLVTEKKLEKHPFYSVALHVRGVASIGKGEFVDGRTFLQRALAEKIARFGAHHQYTALTHTRLAEALAAEGKLELALQQASAASAIFKRIIKREQLSLDPRYLSGELSDRLEKQDLFNRYISIASKLFDTSRGSALRERAFRQTQWSEISTTSAAFNQMRSLELQSDKFIQGIARKYNRTVARLRAHDNLIALGAMSGVSTKTHAPKRAELVQIEERLRAQLQDSLGELAPTATFSPVPLPTVQDSLNHDEVLVTFNIGPAGSYAWYITRKQVVLKKLRVSETWINTRVWALRCNINATLRTYIPSHCRQFKRLEKKTFCLQGQQGQSVQIVENYCAGIAAALYRELFAHALTNQASNIIFVPSGPLLSLPLGMLIAAPPKSGESLKQLNWLALQKGISMLPSIRNLVALKSLKKINYDQSYVGIGNPLLQGTLPHVAEYARRQRSCDSLETNRNQGWFSRLWALLGWDGRLRSSAGQSAAILSHVGGIASRAELLKLQPLPETAREVCGFATSFPTKQTEARLGTETTETAIKTLGKLGGILGRTRIVHFATHALVSDERGLVAEPGLVLTPPIRPSHQDDGYLTAAEIAQLEIRAELVILSACQTAAADSLDAQPLSGLVEGFIRAGARSVLASHWEVKSRATEKLIRSYHKAMTKDKMDRVTSLRVAISQFIKNAGRHETHPAYWAAFFLVGVKS